MELYAIFWVIFSNFDLFLLFVKKCFCCWVWAIAKVIFCLTIALIFWWNCFSFSFDMAKWNLKSYHCLGFVCVYLCKMSVFDDLLECWIDLENYMHHLKKVLNEMIFFYASYILICQSENFVLCPTNLVFICWNFH